MSTPPTKSPLEAAQKIVTELTGMAPEQQTLALKFATETLGLKLPATSLQVVAAAQALPPPIQQQAPLAAVTTGHSLDIKSFTANKSPKSDQQFAALVAYFYQFEARPEERKDAIDAGTMKDAARLAGRSQVSSWNMTLNNAKRSGYLDTDGTGKFKLSSVGENLVAITLPGNGGLATIKNKATKKKAKAKPTKKKSKKKI
jgi:hypothetical protein